MSSEKPSKSSSTSTSSNLSSSELQFCHEYCSLVRDNADKVQRQHRLAQAFLEQFPPEGTVDYPSDWVTSGDKRQAAAERFDRIAESLPQLSECQVNQPRILFNMYNLKMVTWFFAAGFLGSLIARSIGVNAAPGVVNPHGYGDHHGDFPTEIFYKGLHLDNGTGLPFDLYVLDDTMDDDLAFASYVTGCNALGLEKRDWYDCQHLTNIQTLGCNTGHQLGSSVKATGASAMGSYVGTLLHEAFSSNGRDNDSPRSICLTRDGDNLCVSWASYSGATLKAGEAANIEKYSVQCAQSGGSSEFKTTMSNGGILFICVSNRADGCGKGVC